MLVEIRVLSSGLRKAGMLVKGQGKECRLANICFTPAQVLCDRLGLGSSPLWSSLEVLVRVSQVLRLVGRSVRSI